ncbi:MAG: hypothetical protein C4558_08625 [Dehalococcoidia bacterium]|nr:MAG: hypothetical protein C4558_08625 [Dehalococcoidia bacterium]
MGRSVATDQREFGRLARLGWVEHDPEAIWESQIAAARSVLARADVEAREVAAIGITNQRETALVWERASEVGDKPRRYPL